MAFVPKGFHNIKSPNAGLAVKLVLSLLSLHMRKPNTKPIPRWDVDFGGLQNDLKDSTAPHITFTPQLGATDSSV